MSAYPSDQRCPRCQYLLIPGAPVCPNCGLALSGAPGAAPGANPLYPLPPNQPASGGSYSTLPAAGGYGSGPSYGNAGQPPTVYGPPGSVEAAPTVASSLYPQDPRAAGAGPYPGWQPPNSYGSTPNYPSSQPPAYPGSTPAYPGSQPSGTYGSGPAYPGSQPPAAYPGAAPTYPGSQPAGGFGAPPVMTPPMQPPTQQSNRGLRIAIIALVVLVVLGGGGGALAYFLTRPKPTITVTSQYPQTCSSTTPTAGATPAGAPGTTLHITGQKFSASSAITFLLNNQAAPGAPSVTSDADGNVKADLPVTAAWKAGNYTLTARDASNYTTQTGQAITIVDAGEAGTPGPQGAPPDCKSYSITVNVQRQDAVTGQQLQAPPAQTLTVTGQPDPAGGKVCQSRDDGQPHAYTGSDSSGHKYAETVIFQCAGTYKSGVFAYKETATSDKVVFTDGFTCTATGPYTFEEMDGSFSSGTSASGNYSADAVTYNCSSGGPQTFNPEKGTWTGAIGG